MADRRGRVLVVDDDFFNSTLLTTNLEEQGHAAETAEDGETALAMLAQRAYDVVLLDLLMPGIDGHAVLQRMKQNPALRDIPVIMISSSDELERVVTSIELGAEDYLPKPFDPVLLRARLNACLQKKVFAAGAGGDRRRRGGGERHLRARDARGRGTADRRAGAVGARLSGHGAPSRRPRTTPAPGGASAAHRDRRGQEGAGGGGDHRERLLPRLARPGAEVARGGCRVGERGGGCSPKLDETTFRPRVMANPVADAAITSNPRTNRGKAKSLLRFDKIGSIMQSAAQTVARKKSANLKELKKKALKRALCFWNQPRGAHKVCTLVFT
jgi:CheY-like chemotaxis protein